MTALEGRGTGAKPVLCVLFIQRQEGMVLMGLPPALSIMTVPQRRSGWEQLSQEAPGTGYLD